MQAFTDFIMNTHVSGKKTNKITERDSFDIIFPLLVHSLPRSKKTPVLVLLRTGGHLVVDFELVPISAHSNSNPNLVAKPVLI